MNDELAMMWNETFVAYYNPGTFVAYYNPGIRFEGLMKTTKVQSQYSWCS
jgi:hypothetical protein